jgi:hypothetical protein
MSKKVSWEKRYKSIVDNYPQIDDIWFNSENSEDVFIKILGDVLKSERKTSTPGKRPALTKSEGMERIDKILDRDFSDLEFNKSFRLVTNGMSIRSITVKTGLSKSHVQRLLSGQDYPSIETIEKVCLGFKKHPSYFLEYRIYKVLEAVNSLLLDNPETATNWYKKLRK